jgi:hypothetical protein
VSGAAPLYKYRAHFVGLPDCPPGTYAPVARVAFRWVYDPDPQAKSYMPQALKPGARKFHDANDHCCGLAISVYDSESNARRLFTGLMTKFNKKVAREKVMKILGTHLNRLALAPSHGVCEDPDPIDGHMNFHEFAHCELAAVATRVGPA